MVEKGLGEVLGDMEQVLLRVSILCLAIANGQGCVTVGFVSLLSSEHLNNMVQGFLFLLWQDGDQESLKIYCLSGACYLEEEKKIVG